MRNLKKKADPNALLDAVKQPMIRKALTDRIMIYIDGIPIRMSSGKYIWTSIGAAKNALHNSISTIQPYWRDKTFENDPLYGYYTIDELLATGRLEFIVVK